MTRQDSGTGALLVAHEVGLTYGPTVALVNASVTVAAGEVIALVGSSGSGKTSLLYCLAGLALPTTGTVLFRGQDTSELDDEAKARMRREYFGFVFQFAELVPELTLRENVWLPMELNDVPRRERQDRASQLLDDFGLTDQADRRPAQVSGGQAQRAAVARAIAHRPAVIFADEPTGSLDQTSGASVLTSLLGAARVDGAAVVLVTHDADVAQHADRILTMRNGKTDDATPDPALSQSRSADRQ